MPRLPRVSVGETIYHCINRGNGRQTIFANEKEYQHFQDLLVDSMDMVDMRILAYCLMPNHWHLVLYPKNDGDMGEYLRLVTTTHVRQRRVQTKTIGHGHLYQGTYKSFPAETDKYLQQLILYVEQNPLRAGLVKKAEVWHWSSLWMREKGNEKQRKILSKLPTELPKDYLKIVNKLQSKEKLDEIRHCVTKGLPYGEEGWVDEIVNKFNLVSATRGPGKRKKE